MQIVGFSLKQDSLTLPGNIGFKFYLNKTPITYLRTNPTHQKELYFPWRDTLSNQNWKFQASYLALVHP